MKNSHYEKLFSTSIFCKVKTNTKGIFTIGVVYRSQSSTDYENDKLNALIDNVSKRFQNSGEKLLIIGDFNCPDTC